MRTHKKILLLCVLLICAAAVLTVPMEADELRSSAEVTVIEDPTEIVGRMLEDFSDGVPKHWVPGNGVSGLSRQVKNGASCIRVRTIANGGRNCTVSRMYETPPALLSYASLSFPLYLPSGDVEYTVCLILYAGEHTYTSEARMTGGKWNRFTADIGAWPERIHVDRMDITVACDETQLMRDFVLGGISVGGIPDLSSAENFLTLAYTADGGTVEYRDGVYLLNAGQDGAMTLVADLARPETAAESGVRALRIVLSDALEGGDISLSVSGEAASANRFTIASACTLYYGENTYLLAFDSNVPLHSYRLNFRGLYPDGTDGVSLCTVSLETFPEESDFEKNYEGRITSCAFSRDMTELTVTGTVSSDTVAKYIGARLELYEIPMWQTLEEAIAAGNPVASIKISTRYTFRLDLHRRTADASVSRYAVVIAAGDEKIRITSAHYPTHDTEASSRQYSVVGLYGADGTGVFTANASSALVDVYIDRLLIRDGSRDGQLCVRGGHNYFLDYSYIKQLDSEIKFCLSSDVEVYLRIVCAADLSAEGYTIPSEGALLYAIDTSQAAGANMLCAVTEFLAQRYPSISGLIAGGRLDNALYNGSDFSNLTVYARNCANVMRLLYNSAVTYIPDIYVAASVGHYEHDEREAVGMARFDPVLLATMISWQLVQEGELPWGLMYISDNCAEALGHVRNIHTQLKAIDCPSPDNFMILWEPPASYAADVLLAEYSERCLAAQQADIRVLFLSVEDRRNTESIYNGLRHLGVTDDLERRCEIYTAEQIDSTTPYTGRYSIADFSSSYSTLGWTAGSDCEWIGTQMSTVTGKRSLHASFVAANGDVRKPIVGNLLCIDDWTDNMGYAPYIVYSVQLLQHTNGVSSADVTFVFGSGDIRAEYTVTLEAGAPQMVLCDLTPFSSVNTVGFQAITVRCDSAVELEINSVTACSTMYGDEMLAALYSYRDRYAERQTDQAAESFSMGQIVILAAGIFIGVLMLALLSRRRDS